MSATWEGSKGEIYELSLQKDYHWTCLRKNFEGQKGFPLRYDREHSYIWWGKSYFLDLKDFIQQPEIASWYFLADTGKQRAKFIWRRRKHAEVRDAIQAAIDVSSNTSDPW